MRKMCDFNTIPQFYHKSRKCCAILDLFNFFCQELGGNLTTRQDEVEQSIQPFTGNHGDDVA